MLVLSSLLSVALAFPSPVGLILVRGFLYGAGNRDERVSLPPWAARAERAQWNLLANLPAFVTLVLVAAAAGISTEATVSGAQLFFWARLAHAVVYIAGVPYLRTAAFVVSLSGMIRIAREIFSVW